MSLQSRQDAPLAIHDICTLRDNGCTRVLAVVRTFESVPTRIAITVQTNENNPQNQQTPLGALAHGLFLGLVPRTDIFAFDHIRIFPARGQVRYG